MNTDTHKKTRHRFLVAVPLVALVLTVTLFDGVKSLGSLKGDLMIPSSVIVSDKDHAQTVILKYSALELQAGSEVDLHDSMLPILKQGTALIATRGIFSVKAGDMIFQLWNGASQISITEKSLTIAALSSPVLVTQGTEKMIVPAYSQWTSGDALSSLESGIDGWTISRSVKPLPTSFISDALSRSQKLAAAIPPVKTVDGTAGISLPLSDTFKLSSAKQREESVERIARISALIDALSKQSSDLQTLLGAEDLADLLSSKEGQVAMPVILSLALEQGKGDLFLPYFTEQTDRLLIAQYHPLIRDHAWVLPVSGLSDADNAVRLFSLPFSDALSQSLAPLAFSRWQTVMQDFLASRKDSEAIVKGLIPAYAEQIQRFSNLQYPERVSRYSKGVEEMGGTLLPHPDPLPPRLPGEGDGKIPPLPGSGLKERGSKTSLAVPVAPELLQEQARASLAVAGFMFLPTTSFRAIGSSVEVTDIAFGTKDGDTVLHFTFDPATQNVSAITQNGVTMPNTMELGKFVDWGRK